MKNNKTMTIAELEASRGLKDFKSWVSDLYRVGWTNQANREMKLLESCSDYEV